MAKQHVVVAVAVEIADASDLPVGVPRKAGRLGFAANCCEAIQFVDVPTTLVPQEDVIFAITVEVPDMRAKRGHRNRATREQRPTRERQPGFPHGHSPLVDRLAARRKVEHPLT